MTQLSGVIGIPMVYTVELLDWVTGGPEPEAMRLAVAMPRGQQLNRWFLGCSSRE